MPKKPTKTSTLPDAIEMVTDLMKTLRGYTVRSGLKCEGQATIERRGDAPTVIMYATYPNGDYMCWFNDKKKFRMFALVNENLREVFECNPNDLPLLFDKLAEIKPQFEKANPSRGRA